MDGEQRSKIFQQIFTSEDVELPRPAVADYLESIQPQLCARFLEHLINDHKEDSESLHNRLAELYLSVTLSARKMGDQSM